MAQTDEELMLSYQKGDYTAFEVLYAHSSPKVYGYLKKKLITHTEVDDVFQQIFMKIHRSREQYDSQYLFEQWLFVIARSVLLDHYRSKGKNPIDEADTDELKINQLPAPLSQTPGSSSYTEGVDQNILQNLNDEQKKVVEWRVLDDLTYEEIALKLKRSEATVRQIFSRAIRKLRSTGSNG